MQCHIYNVWLHKIIGLGGLNKCIHIEKVELVITKMSMTASRICLHQQNKDKFKNGKTGFKNRLGRLYIISL